MRQTAVTVETVHTHTGNLIKNKKHKGLCYLCNFVLSKII